MDASARPLRSRALRLAALALALGAGAGCRQERGDSGGTVLHLAAAYRPPDALLPTAGGGRGFDLDFRVEAEDWIAQPTPGLWRARAPWYANELPVLLEEPARLALEPGGERERVALDEADLAGSLESLPARGGFSILREVDGDYVLLGLAEGAAPPAATLSVRLSAGAPRDGRWRVAGGPVAADGFVVRADAPAVLAVDVPPRARLSFDAVCVALGRRPRAEVVLRVRLDGELIAERALVPGDDHAAVPIALPLPPEGRKGARIDLELEGEAWCALLEPRIAPSASAPSARPDVVVFLADTLRADALGVQGGPEGLTPAIDAFAAQGVRFARTWAPSCWTLPSHASMFLGLYPPQHGAVAPDLSPGAGLVSLAERLRAAGYRTVAVTDSLFVSRRFDLDRGFERFEEYHTLEVAHAVKEQGLARTLRRARELAAADDGRPLFLFVHTYRVHEPYEVTPETLAELGPSLDVQATWDELQERVNRRLLEEVQRGNERALRIAVEGDFHALLEELRFTGPEAEGKDGGAGFVAAIRALYLAGVHDLDRGFGALLADLDARPRARDTWVIFTSDHGEAFQEHATMFHGAGAWEENLRVPLIVRGPGLAAGVVERGASLVDLPKTVAEIAGVAPDPRWGGRSLLSLEGERAIFAFDCAQRGEATAMAVEDGLKVHFPPDPAAIASGRATRAYDLAVDPLEQVDLAHTPRARTALERLAERATELLEPLAAPGAADLDARARQRMAAMGYVEGDAEPSENR